MTNKILLDHGIEGYAVYLRARWQEAGWDQYVTIEFLRLHDIHLPDDASDQEIWRRSQEERLLLITHNRHRDDETSLQATIERENTPDALPVITISSVEKLRATDYRQQAAHKLAEIILYLEDYLGVGRVYIP